MSPLSSLSDSELVARLPALVHAERHAMADVIEHLVEMERRRLYLSHAVSSLYRYCIERLGYAEDAALKRHRVAKLALRLPQVLEELLRRNRAPDRPVSALEAFEQPRAHSGFVQKCFRALPSFSPRSS